MASYQKSLQILLKNYTHHKTDRSFPNFTVREVKIRRNIFHWFMALHH